MAERTILLVEDNDDNAAIFQAVLEHHGYVVARAADGEEGLRLAREMGPDAILLDISLPRLSGWEVAEELRSGGPTAPIPILVCTAHDGPEDHARAERIGCDAYLTKPCTPRQIAEEVARCLARSEPVGEPEAITSGDDRVRLEEVARTAVAVLLIAVAAGFHLRGRTRRSRWRSRLSRLPRTSLWS